MGRESESDRRRDRILPCVVSALPALLCCFLRGKLTHTTDAREVQAIAEGTLAAKGAIGVDTMTTGTDTRVLHTLVHV